MFAQRGCGSRPLLLANLAVPASTLGPVALAFLLVTVGAGFAGAGVVVAAGLYLVHFLAFSGARFAVLGVTACPRCEWTRVGDEVRPRDEVLRRGALGFFRSVLRSLLLARLSSHLYRTDRSGDDPRSRVVCLFAL